MGSCNKWYKILYKKTSILIVRRHFSPFFCLSDKDRWVKQTQVCQLTRRNNPNLGFMGCFELFDWQGESGVISGYSQYIHSGLSEVSGYFQSTRRPVLAWGRLFQCCMLLATLQIAPHTRATHVGSKLMWYFAFGVSGSNLTWIVNI